MHPSELILTNFQSPGDIVMLTAAVRDLHRCYPGAFRTDVRTSAPVLWEGNPYVTRVDPGQDGVRVISCEYPSIHESNRRPIHFLQGFVDHLNRELDLEIRLTRFGGDVHLSAPERRRSLLPPPLRDSRRDYWIIVAGGKYDFTIKWWHFRRWQAVVDAWAHSLTFVQVGEADHYHPPLRGVVDLRGRTSLRELIRLVYHAAGVVCPVTLLMHLAAAVPVPRGRGRSRPCVVVAGGRESPSWESYPWHQFLHTVGALPCCADGGCWRSRTVPLGDGDEKDEDQHLCQDVVGGLPRCMDLITPEDVCRRIELYRQNGDGTGEARKAPKAECALVTRADPGRSGRRGARVSVAEAI